MIKDTPKITFVVPCYNLAHLLPECVSSILAQTCEDFEVLIMDDSSPDNTPEVARSFGDPRVIHVRNEVNLGHLRNYNRGIGLSRGEYVWLISADDRLRRPYVLEKYLALMEAHPEVGYVFCPGFGMRDHEETCLLEYSRHGDEDTVFDGRKFLCELLKGNTVVAASGMVRKQLYENIGVFPLDLPYAGDWYLWCLFALHSDVGYLAEPMVNYREHQLSVTVAYMNDRAHAWKAEGIAVAWRIKRAVEATEHLWLVSECDDSIVRQYASSLALYGLTPIELEQLLREYAANSYEAKQIRVRSYLQGGDSAFGIGDRYNAVTLYGMALRSMPANFEILLKYATAKTGKYGDRARKIISSIRHRVRPGRLSRP